MNNRQIPGKARGFDIWWLVGRTNIKVHRALTLLLGELGLSLAQHEILTAIWQNPGITQQQLAEILLVVKSNVSALVAKLEKGGLVERAADPEDNRNKLLFLSPSGEKLVLKSLKKQNQFIEKMMSVMSNNDLKKIDQIMRRVGDSLDEIIK